MSGSAVGKHCEEIYAQTTEQERLRARVDFLAKLSSSKDAGASVFAAGLLHSSAARRERVREEVLNLILLSVSLGARNVAAAGATQMLASVSCSDLLNVVESGMQKVLYTVGDSQNGFGATLESSSHIQVCHLICLGLFGWLPSVEARWRLVPSEAATSVVVSSSSSAAAAAAAATTTRTTTATAGNEEIAAGAAAAASNLQHHIEFVLPAVESWLRSTPELLLVGLSQSGNNDDLPSLLPGLLTEYALGITYYYHRKKSSVPPFAFSPSSSPPPIFTKLHTTLLEALAHIHGTRIVASPNNDDPIVSPPDCSSLLMPLMSTAGDSKVPFLGPSISPMARARVEEVLETARAFGLLAPV